MTDITGKDHQNLARAFRALVAAMRPTAIWC
jgi:hypothetical protein